MKNCFIIKMENICEICEEKICVCPVCSRCGEIDVCSCKICEDCGYYSDDGPCFCYACDVCGSLKDCFHNYN
jgi:hypothetical protein